MIELDLNEIQQTVVSLRKRGRTECEHLMRIYSVCRSVHPWTIWTCKPLMETAARCMKNIEDQIYVELAKELTAKRENKFNAL